MPGSLRDLRRSSHRRRRYRSTHVINGCHPFLPDGNDQPVHMTKKSLPQFLSCYLGKTWVIEDPLRLRLLVAQTPPVKPQKKRPLALAVRTADLPAGPVPMIRRSHIAMPPSKFSFRSIPRWKVPYKGTCLSCPKPLLFCRGKGTYKGCPSQVKKNIDIRNPRGTAPLEVVLRTFSVVTVRAKSISAKGGSKPKRGEHIYKRAAESQRDFLRRGAVLILGEAKALSEPKTTGEINNTDS